MNKLKEYLKICENIKQYNEELNNIHNSDQFVPNIHGVNRIIITESNNIITKTNLFTTNYFSFLSVEDIITNKSFEIKYIKEKAVTNTEMVIINSKRCYNSIVVFIIDEEFKKIQEIKKINLSNLCVLVETKMVKPGEGENIQFVYSGFNDGMIGCVTLLINTHSSSPPLQLTPDKSKYNTIDDFINHLLKDS